MQRLCSLRSFHTVHVKPSSWYLKPPDGSLSEWLDGLQWQRHWPLQNVLKRHVILDFVASLETLQNVTGLPS